MARVMRQSVRHHRNFSLAKYGSWEAAEAAAAAWLDALLPTLPPQVPREGRRLVVNTSGEPGVSLGCSIFRRPDRPPLEYYRWTARWPGCPLRGGVNWSWSTYGDEDAYVLAVLSRRLRIVDRDQLVAKLREIAGTEEYRAILRQWTK